GGQGGVGEGASVMRKCVGLYSWEAYSVHDMRDLVIVAMEGRLEDQPVAAMAGKFGGALPMAWSFMLALRARGLGSCWTTLHIYEETAVAQALGIPDNVSQTVLLPVAYYTGDDFRPATRPAAGDYIHWNRWGDHASPAA
ncbi:MAG: nitroreductase family protein, partial [Pseudomonadota bacterium]|nr:nitroreductase family protein [Pseudomonadota bacterium]